MVADLFISAHRRNTLGELYVRRGGHFRLDFLLNLTTTPLGVINCHFYFVGACTCTKGAVKKSPQEKRLRSCKKARQQSFFVV